VAAPLLAADAPPAAAATKPAALTPPANLVTDGVPPIPASIAEDANRFTEFRAAALASWHPVRREMLVRTRFADTLQVHHVRQPMGVRRQLTFFPDSVAGAAFPPAPDGKDPGTSCSPRTSAGRSSSSSTGTTWPPATRRC
jgi:hypothetical protein